ncbi:hypothetical protein Scep_010892 [Stephania cephalantha]|uniref:RRM domain-containing protein n=1 Tax=Stephania cephalantha TaxID=152367 RepID=A0AAP0JW94_9MAGN
MPNPSRSNVVSSSRQPSHGSEESGDGGGLGPSHNLWIGNLANDVTDADLMDLFATYGALDSVTTYSSRSYAFVYFKRLEDARAAKDALQGTVLRGGSLKIEFARPSLRSMDYNLLNMFMYCCSYVKLTAKPGKHLWVGAISSSVTKEQLENEFSKFGKIEDLKFLRDRNSALIDYARLEDASAALKNMNGKRLGGEQIRVDFLRSQGSRRESWSDTHDSRDGHASSRRNMAFSEPFWMQNSIGRREGPPSKVLWIGYPPSLQIDEQMLHNAMILFGEIERIKSFPSRNYSFVEFRSVDEARRAKEGLQGRLFNDSRINICFSSSELAPPKDTPGFFMGMKGPRPEIFLNEPPFGPGAVEFFGQGRPGVPNNFPGAFLAKGMAGPNLLMRPFGLHSGFDHNVAGAEMLNDLSGPIHSYHENNPNSPMGQSWRRQSPSAPGILPTPSLGMRPPPRHMSGILDGPDASPFQRESKRSRINGSPLIDDGSFPARKMDGQGVGGEPAYEFDSQPGQIHYSPARRVSGRSSSQGPLEDDHCWRGIIAKGGSPVCQARCVPIGKGISSPLPEIVNCSARTGLDMLAKHYADAIGFEIVFFLPDSEDDFVSYTEFLRYLGGKDRAGVAKLDDGTTLFLVPPSDFLTDVLNFSGPERLYGVVLRMAHQMLGAPSQQPQQSIAPPDYVDRQHLPPQSDYNLFPQKEDRILQMDYNKQLQELAVPQPPNHLYYRQKRHLWCNQFRKIILAARVSLTPDLLATIAALLPANSQPSSSTNILPPVTSSSSRMTSYPTSVAIDGPASAQGWRQDQQSNFSHTPHHLREEHGFNSSQHSGHLFTSPTQQPSQFPAYANGLENSAQTTLINSQAQDASHNVMQQGAYSSRLSNNFASPSQSVQLTTPQQTNHQYQVDASLNHQRIHGIGRATDGTELINSPALQQVRLPATLPSLVQGGTIFSQQQAGMPPANDGMNALPNQVQQVQAAIAGGDQGVADDEAEKNQRYKSTLEFAANLLQQIQQRQTQQQQGNSQVVQESGNH